MRKGTKRALLAGLTLVIAVSLVVEMLAGGVWREEEAVHINPDEIEVSTLVIGAHLIHLSALTDSIYEIAQESAGQSGQTRIYYKSELAEGTWFDITTASGLADITTGGSPVTKDVIAELFFTHHTRSDGITYDLRTGRPVNLNDIVDPYDLEAMSELFPLKTYYDTLKESEEKDASAKVERIAQLFSADVQNSDTNTCDKQLSGLQAYYSVLKDNNGGSAEMSVVQGVMDGVDAKRRVYVFLTVEALLDEYSKELMGVAAEEAAEGEEAPPPPEASTDTTLQSAVNDSLTNVKNALIENEGKMLDPGSTVLSEVYYDLASQLITDAGVPNHAACDGDVAQMICLDNIKAGTISRKEDELALLTNTLLKRATEAYTGRLWAGVNDTYRTAVAQNAAQVLLNGIADENVSTINTARNELEFLITAYGQRIGNEEGMAYMDERLALTNSWFDSIPADPFREGAEITVNQHLEFLNNLRRQMELANGGNEMDALMAEKQDLQTQMMSALDDNDLVLAKELEEAILALDDQMDKLRDSGLAMSDGTLGAMAGDLKQNAMDAIRSGDGDAAKAAVDALGSMLSMDSGLIFPMLSDLHKSMAAQNALSSGGGSGGSGGAGGSGGGSGGSGGAGGSGPFADAMAAIEEVVLNNADAYAAAMRTEKSLADLEGIVDGYLSGEGSGLLNTGLSSGDLEWQEEGVVYLAALQMYYQETGSDAALAAMASFARRQMELGNPLVFLRYNDGSYEYLPLSALRWYTGMRYVWNSNQNQGTLARGSTYYGFTVYSDLVLRGESGELVDQMRLPARYQNGIHVYEEYTLEEFGAEAMYLSGTQYGVLIHPELQNRAEELFGLFLA